MAEVDRAAFERFVGEHGDRLLHAAYGLCGDWQHAEDLVQHALVGVARHWPTVSTSPLGYAYRCLVRANIDRWRVSRRRPEVLLDPHELATVGPTSAPFAAEDHLVVLAALQTLPRRQRAIVVLRYLQDLSEADTATALGISVGAVKSGGARGLARLRAEQSSRLEEVHGDEQTISGLRRAANAAVRGHRLEPDVAAAAWSAAHAPRHRAVHLLAIAAGVLGAVGAATALAVWGTGSEHANPPAGGSACAGSVTTAPLPTWARAGFSPSGLDTPHVLGEHGQIIAVLFVPLRVHQPAGTHNKVLWVAKVGYGPMHVRARLEGTSRTVTTELPDGPGPSYVNMPSAGCWQMSLTWAGYHDTVALRYEP